MGSVIVSLDQRSYEIVIEGGILEKTGSFLSRLQLGKKALLVSNQTVYTLHGQKVVKSLLASGFSVTEALVPDGEEYKNLHEAEKLYHAAYAAGLDRNCPVIALGGGVIGDLAGFVAATYMRGVPFIQIPTTLLAQVDSSVGGKVAINHPQGKNIVGSFYQPSIVLADFEVLQTLPARELRSGFAEIVKYGVIKDASFFSWLEENAEAVLALEEDDLGKAVEQSCRIKARVVEEDETEQGTRAILNFGHTVAHALEAITGYTVYRHGEAVAIGMVAAAQLAEKMGLFSASDRERLENLLQRAGLPTEIPAEFTTSQLLKYFYLDKKATAGRITFVLPQKIGQVVLRRDLQEKEILNYL